MNTELIKQYANIAVISCASYFFMTYSSTVRLVVAIVVSGTIVTTCNLDLTKVLKDYNDSLAKKREDIVKNSQNKNQI